MRRLLGGLGVGVLLFGVGAGGTHLYDTRYRIPRAFHQACGLVIDAYDEVAKRATADRNIPNADGHDPVDYWAAAQQAKLDAAAEFIEDPRGYPSRWENVAEHITHAAQNLNPQIVAQVVAVQTMEQQGDYSQSGRVPPNIDPSRIGQSQALATAQAACVER